MSGSGMLNHKHSLGEWQFLYSALFESFIQISRCSVYSLSAKLAEPVKHGCHVVNSMGG